MSDKNARGQIVDGPLQATDKIQSLGSPTSERVALVLGFGRYLPPAALKNPGNDASKMAQALCDMGFHVLLGLDLTFPEFTEAHSRLDEILRVPRRAALLFYAGHAVQVEGQNYLIPCGVKISSKAHLKMAINVDDLLGSLREGAKTSLVFLDACRDNPFTRSLIKFFHPGDTRKIGDSLPTSGPVRGGLAELTTGTDVFIAFATAPNSVAYDGDTEHSPFTRALLKYMKTPGASITDVMIDVRRSVFEETAGKQNPWEHSGLHDHFYFVAAPQPLPAKPAQSNRKDADAEYKEILKTPSIAALTDFAARQPQYAKVADMEIQNIRMRDREQQKGKSGQFTAAVPSGRPAGNMVAAAKSVKRGTAKQKRLQGDEENSV